MPCTTTQARPRRGFVLLALVLAAFQARAETVNCTPITTLPAVITVQGVYCFKGNLATAMASGNAIDIQTNNVVLDLNGFKLGGLSAGLGTNTFGIYALDRQNITIRNGTIRGFRQANRLWTIPRFRRATSSKTFAPIRIPKSEYTSGVPATSFATIRWWRPAGTTVFGPNAPTSTDIYVSGTGPRVLNNDVIDTVATGPLCGHGISSTVPRLGALCRGEQPDLRRRTIGSRFSASSPASTATT